MLATPGLQPHRVGLVPVDLLEIDKISEWEELGDETPPAQPFRLVGKFPLPDEPPLSSYENPFTGEPLDPEKVKKNIYI